MKRVLIIGATSAIAEAVARCFAADGDRLYLTGRRVERLEQIAADLRLRGATQVAIETLDVLDYDRHTAVFDNATQQLGGLDTLLIAHGTLPDQQDSQSDVERSRRELEINGLSVIALLTEVAQRFSTQGHGHIAVIGSVAGDRGRQSNYVYGSAKAAVSTFLQGLRNRLTPQGISVLTVKPGFVDTPMTADFPKGPLWATPDRVGKDIHRAIIGGKDVLYTPWFWRWIMLIIRLIPEPIFKRLKL